MEKLLALLPEQILSELAIETKVDYYAKKLQGEVLFKLLLYCLLTTKESSLRSAASAYESALFGALNTAYTKGSVRYNSISERLSTINADYFKQLYQYCIKTYKDTIGADDTDKLLRFDSTIVALSGKLLKAGYELKGGDAAHLRNLKFTIGLSGIPEAADLYTEQSYSSENTALKASIIRHSSSGGRQEDESVQIRVFDRGITSRLAYDLLSEKGIRFISRINHGAKHTPVGQNRIEEPVVSERLIIEQDIDVQLYGSESPKPIKTNSYLRCIKARLINPSDEKKAVLWFITNMSESEIDAQAVCELYRKRWDIEGFFKFLKQHLNFAHLLNRSENGVKVMLYVTMIAAILVMAYRKLCGARGYKLVKQQLAQELETEILKTIITLCGGNPELLHQILKVNSS